MRLMLRAVTTTLVAHVLWGCSAAILATGTDEGSIIHQGSTKTALNQTLGQPFRVEALEPRPVWDMRRPRFNLLVEPVWVRDSSGKPQFEPPLDEAVEMAYYRFVGVLKRRHDAAEAVSLGLMTFGASEVVMTPAAATDRASEREYVLIAWFDRSGKALAYEWTRFEIPK